MKNPRMNGGSDYSIVPSCDGARCWGWPQWAHPEWSRGHGGDHGAVGRVFGYWYWRGTPPRLFSVDEHYESAGQCENPYRVSRS